MAKQPALLACLACREKHLKCDGQKPRCQRCSQAGSDCRWTPSRRGYRGIRKRTFGSDSIVQSLNDIAHQNVHGPALSGRRRDMQVPVWFSQLEGQNDTPAEAMGLGLDFSDFDSNTLQPVSGISNKVLMAQDEEQRLLDLYYSNFHAAHPILPPARCLSQVPSFPPSLDAIVKLIGSHFDDSISTDDRFATVRTALRAPEPNSYYKVQALILFSIVLHARNLRNESIYWLDMAIDTALELGLNEKSFAASHGMNNPILEESVRRTWWELYIVDGMTAALHQRMDFRTSSVLTDVDLPCDERTYLQCGYIPEPRTVAQLRRRAFAEEDLDFSSFCYRIDAVILLSRVMSVGGDVNGKEEAEGIDLALSSWCYHLPQSKQEVLAHDGTVDEMLFQAYMIINCAIVYFHLPRSDLFANAQGQSTNMPCAERLNISLPASTPHTHAVKTIEAANRLSSLASLQVPAEKHTPFFVCSLVLDSIVQLSACTMKTCQCLETHRDGITLAIGVLKALNQTWPISQPALQQIKAVARMVLESGVQPIGRQITHEDSVDIQSILSSEVLLGDTPDLDKEEIELPI